MQKHGTLLSWSGCPYKHVQTLRNTLNLSERTSKSELFALFLNYNGTNPITKDIQAFKFRLLKTTNRHVKCARSYSKPISHLWDFV